MWRKGRTEDDDFRPSDLQGPSVADPSCSGSLNKVTVIIKKSALLLILSVYFIHVLFFDSNINIARLVTAWC